MYYIKKTKTTRNNNGYSFCYSRYKLDEELIIFW